MDWVVLSQVVVAVLFVILFCWAMATGKIEYRLSPQQQLMLDAIDLRLEELKTIAKEGEEES